MEDIKLIISQNIVELRRRSGMTQSILAEKLNYSDKAVSKWERGESTPDITVLKSIADLFGVTVDYLITSEHSEEPCESEAGDSDDISVIKKIKRRRRVVTIMSTLIVWVIATLLFVILDLCLDGTWAHYLTFAYAIPAAAIVWLVFNSIWHNRRLNYIIISLFMWSTLFAVHLSALAGGVNAWQMYLLGIPGQLIISLWSVIGKDFKKK